MTKAASRPSDAAMDADRKDALKDRPQLLNLRTCACTQSAARFNAGGLVSLRNNLRSASGRS